MTVPTPSGRMDASTSDAEGAPTPDEDSAASSVVSFADLQEICRQAYASGIEYCAVRRLALQTGTRSGSTTALIRIAEGQRRHDRIAIERDGRWLVPACRVMSVEGDRYPWNQVVDDVRTAAFIDSATGPVLAVRYVRHKGGFEPHGVGADGNGDGPNVREHGTYEDHLVEVSLTTLACLDAMIVEEEHPDRIVPYGPRGAPSLGSVPSAWRKNVHLKPGPLGGAILE